MTGEKEHVEQIPVVQVTLTRPDANGGGLSFQTYVAQDKPVHEMHAVMDKLAAVADRQSLHADIAREEQLLYNEQVEHGRQTDALDDLDRLHHDKAAGHPASGRGAFKLSEAEAKQREGCVRTITMMRNRIEERARRISEMRGKLGD